MGNQAHNHVSRRMTAFWSVKGRAGALGRGVRFSVESLTMTLAKSLSIAVAGLALFGAAAASDRPELDLTQFDFDHVSCTGAPNEIRLVIEGFDNAVGLVTVDLYVNDNAGFLKRAGRVAQRRAAAKSPFTKLCIRAPEPGQYAIAVYHDKNANKTFDKNAFGLPAEPWGISNNPKIRFGPPHVDEALFPVDADAGAEVAIKLN